MSKKSIARVVKWSIDHTNHILGTILGMVCLWGQVAGVIERGATGIEIPLYTAGVITLLVFVGAIMLVVVFGSMILCVIVGRRMKTWADRTLAEG